MNDAELRAAREHGRALGTSPTGSAIDCPYYQDVEPELRRAWLAGFSEARRARRAA